MDSHGNLLLVDLMRLGTSREISEVEAKVTGDLGMISVQGVISYGNTIEITQELDRFMQSSAISTILIAIDSPGGTLPGVPELADTIHRAGKVKKIVAVASPLAASAAYWIASAATELYAVPSAEVGSVGVYLVHVCLEELLKKEGVDVSLISSSPEKVEGNPFRALTQEGKDYLQSQVNKVSDDFVSALSLYRGVSVEHVRKTFGGGRLVDANEALKNRMIDFVATPEKIAEKLAGVANTKNRAKAKLVARRRAKKLS
jgi:signal peptide peptidase SppA